MYAYNNIEVKAMDNLIYNPTNARKNLFSILKKVNKDHTPITIESNKDNDESAILVSKKDWNSLQETLYLAQNGVAKVVQEREKDNSGFTDIDDIDWDKL